MSDLRKAAQQALEALEIPSGGQDLNDMALAVSRATLALRAALAQQAEPVAPSGYAYRYPDGLIRFTGGRSVNGANPTEAIPYWFGAPPAHLYRDAVKCVPLYTEPPRREWVSLSDEEIEQRASKAFTDYMEDKNDDQDLAFARAIEASLKEKNHG
jgi:hypothetical protein